LIQLFPPDDERLSLETCRGGKINTLKRVKKCVKLVENPQLFLKVTFFLPVTSTVQILNVNVHKSQANLSYCDVFHPIVYETNQTTKIPSHKNFGYLFPYCKRSAIGYMFRRFMLSSSGRIFLQETM
jgi:hypothetical protein